MDEHNKFQRSQRLSGQEKLYPEILREIQNLDIIMNSWMITAEDRLHMKKQGIISLKPSTF